MIPKTLLKELLSDKYYEKCVRLKEGTCRGRVTFEHALQYANRQVNAKFAIIPLCEFHHSVLTYQDRGNLEKEKNQWYALNRATEEDFAKYPKSDWRQKLKYLNSKYGHMETR